MLQEIIKKAISFFKLMLSGTKDTETKVINNGTINIENLNVEDNEKIDDIENEKENME